MREIKDQKSNIKKIEIIVGKNERKVIPYVWVNGREEEIWLEVRLIGEGASVTIVGIFLGTGNNSIIFNTNIIHEVKNTKSLTTLRGVFKDKASFNNDGMVRIYKGAKGADGFFSSKILLFDDSKGRSVPSLEIDENDLKAGHASTVGRPNEEQLFYLRSRGLNEKEAENLIISGFFQQILYLFSENEQEKIKKEIQSTLK